MPYTSLNGNMFSFLDNDGRLGLRLAEQQRTDFLRAHKTTLCEKHGTILKEYVLVPDAVFRNPARMAVYFKASREYARSLKPKPSKKSG